MTTERLTPKELPKPKWAYGRPCVLGIAFAISACATTPAPVGPVALSTAALQNATNADAAVLAPEEMEVAKAKMGLVKSAMLARDYRRALWLAEEAQVDSQLAEARARSVRARRLSGASP